MVRERCVSPDGPDLPYPPPSKPPSNATTAFPLHRFDQAVLSVVASTANIDIHAKEHSQLCVRPTSREQDNAALIALPGAPFAGAAQGPEFHGAQVILRSWTCVERRSDKKRGKVNWYDLGGMFQVKFGDEVLNVRGEELVACSVHDPNADTPLDDDGMGEITNCTHGGMKIKYMRDIPGHDLDGVNERAVKLEVCMKDAWLNHRSQGFTYDLESGLCWPKAQVCIPNEPRCTWHTCSRALWHSEQTYL